MQKKILVATIATLFALATSAEARNFNVTLTPTKGGKVTASSVETDTTIDYPGGPPPASVNATLDSGDPTWARPGGSTAGGANYNGEPTCLENVVYTITDNVAYDTYTINNTGASQADIIMNTTGCGGTTGWDPVSYLYSPPFNPASPLTGCLDANDDVSGLDYCTTLTFSIPAGGQRVMVIGAWCDDTPAGCSFTLPQTYAVEFTGTVPVELQSFDIN